MSEKKKDLSDEKIAREIVDKIWNEIDRNIDENNKYQEDFIEEAYRKAGGLECGEVVFDIRDRKIKVISYQPNTYQPDVDPFLISLYYVEPNWMANSSWNYRDILGEDLPEDIDDVDAWADQKAREQGFENFFDVLVYSIVYDEQLNIPTVKDLMDPNSGFNYGIIDIYRRLYYHNQYKDFER